MLLQLEFKVKNFKFSLLSLLYFVQIIVFFYFCFYALLSIGSINCFILNLYEGKNVLTVCKKSTHIGAQHHLQDICSINPQRLAIISYNFFRLRTFGKQIYISIYISYIQPFY